MSARKVILTMTTRNALILAVLLAAVSVLVGGCRPHTRSTAVVAAVPPDAPYVELTYPQSDDEGHIVAVPAEGEVSVSGFVAAREVPKAVIVNDVRVQPYVVRSYRPFGAPEAYAVYGFRAPITCSPTTRLTIVVEAGRPLAPCVFVPDTHRTITRLVYLKGHGPKTALVFSRYRIANAYRTCHRYNEAVVAYRSCLAAEPKFYWADYGIGTVFAAQARFGDAVIYYRRASGLYPDWPEPYYGLGLAYVSLGRPRDAIVVYQRANRLWPYWCEPYYGLGTAYTIVGNLGPATIAFSRCTTYYPAWWRPRYAWAGVLLRQGHYDDAIVQYREVVRLAPKHAGAHRGLAVALYNRGHYAEAWEQVHLARDYGSPPPHDFVTLLSKKLPEPKGRHVAERLPKGSQGHGQEGKGEGRHAASAGPSPGHGQEGKGKEGAAASAGPSHSTGPGAQAGGSGHERHNPAAAKSGQNPKPEHGNSNPVSPPAGPSHSTDSASHGGGPSHDRGSSSAVPSAHSQGSASGGHGGGHSSPGGQGKDKNKGH
jgi:Flp pilus assembly protein TadD